VGQAAAKSFVAADRTFTPDQNEPERHDTGFTTYKSLYALE
jgi:hypothetical protein